MRIDVKIGTSELDARANWPHGSRAMVENVRVEDAAKVRKITLDRPAKKNALTVAMYAALDGALSAAATDDRISVVQIGAVGDAFCAGNDIVDFMRAATGAAEGLSPRPAASFLQTLASFPKPLVAAVNGLAIGIGATLLLHCDYVVASSAAAFQFPFSRLALVPEAGSSVLLPARVGAQRAAEWLLFGDRIDAETALRSGLVNAVVAPNALEGAATTRVRALADLAIGSLVETKRLLREPQRDAVRQAMSRELEAFAMRLGTPEAAAAFSAFLSRAK
jgi:enoyl-CoA hydratase/carnithine racemase